MIHRILAAAVVASAVVVVASEVSGPLEFAAGAATAKTDGVIGDGEYSASFALQYKTAQRHAKDNFMALLQARTYFAWDDERLYVAVRSDAETVRVQPRARDGNLWEDDSVEIYISGDDIQGDMFQFIFNTRGDIYDSRNGSSKFNAAGVESKSSVKDGWWNFEAAIPWKDIGVAHGDGAKLRINVARKYYGGGKNRIGMGDARWAHAGMSFGTALAREGTWSAKASFAVMTLSRSLAKWAAPDVKAPEGTRGEVAIPVEVRASDGTVVLKTTMYHKIPDPVKFRCVWTDRKTDTLNITTENWLARDGDAVIHLDFRDYPAGACSKFKTSVPAVGAYGRTDQKVDVSALPDGLYKVCYTLAGRAGEELGRDFFYYAKCPDGKAPWDGIQAGLEDKVLYPWTSPDFDDTAFSCWNRRVKFSNGSIGIINSMVSAGKEILRHPVMLDLDWKPMKFRCRRTARGLSYADYVFEAEGQPVTIEMRAEFDGLMWFKVRYGKAGMKVQNLRLRIPLKRDIVMAWDDCYSAYEKVRIRPGQKGEWSANAIHRPFFWAGGEVGLMGGHPGLKGWHLQNKGSGTVFKVEDESATVTLNFVDVPFEMEDARTLEFYLEPTPVRPRRRIVSTVRPKDVLHWTGYLSDFFETKIPGMMWDERWQIFDNIRRGGRRTFYYFASKGASPVFPWWGRYGDDWNLSGDPGSSVLEIPRNDRTEADKGRWTWTCCNSRSYLDYKLYSLDFFVSNPKYGVHDLYFDLSWPRVCANPTHGCKWTDEFGTTCFENDIKGMREFQKRATAILQRKNPQGAIRGHITCTRTPADVFFDILSMGETYERKVAAKHCYYDILTPDDMEVTYGMRANEVDMLNMCQLYRTISVYAPALLPQWDPNKPEFDRAIRHFAAYHTIFDLVYRSVNEHGRDEKLGGGQMMRINDFKLSMGPDVKTVAYWHADNPVKVDVPEERFIYAVTSGREKMMLTLLNDTDREVAKIVSLDIKPYFVKNPTGKDIFGRGEFSLENGSFKVVLPPRESRFIAFE